MISPKDIYENKRTAKKNKMDFREKTVFLSDV